MSDLEKRAISTAFFNRLHDVYQNSTVYLTFPTNQTKRFEHSVGTLELAGDMFRYAVSNTDTETLADFLSYFTGLIRKLYREFLNDVDKYDGYFQSRLDFISQRSTENNQDIPCLPSKIHEHAFTTLIPINVPVIFRSTYILLLQAIRLCALLHDIGHPPFSHIVERALEELYSDQEATLEADRTPRGKEFVEICKRYFNCDNQGNKHQLHEEMGERISNNIFRAIISDTVRPGKYNQDVQLYEITVWQMVMNIFQDATGFEMLHLMIDGSLDADRLDYITRDAVNSGLKTGSVEYHRILNTMRIVYDKNDSFFYFCPSIKSLNNVEDMLYRRWRVYKHIIYHHHVVKTDSLLEKVVVELGLQYLQSTEKPSYGASKVIPNDISGLWKALASQGTTDIRNAISQWDDSWLITTLKRYYFSDYYDIDSSDSKYQLAQKLAELLTNKRCYISLIKRADDFKKIDQALFQYLRTKKKDLLSKEKSLVKKNEDIAGVQKAIEKKSKGKEAELAKSGVEVKKPSTIPIEATIDFLNSFFAADNYSQSAKNGFLLCKVLEYTSYILGAEAIKDKDVVCEVQKCIDKFILSDSCSAISGAFVVLKRQKVKDPTNARKKDVLCLYREEFGEANLVDIKDVSSIQSSIKRDWDYFPYFYIYALPKENLLSVGDSKEKLFTTIGAAVGEHFWKIIEDDLAQLDKEATMKLSEQKQTISSIKEILQKD